MDNLHAGFRWNEWSKGQYLIIEHSPSQDQDQGRYSSLKGSFLQPIAKPWEGKFGGKRSSQARSASVEGALVQGMLCQIAENDRCIVQSAGCDCRAFLGNHLGEALRREDIEEGLAGLLGDFRNGLS
jgi:hypothetical protein